MSATSLARELGASAAPQKPSGQKGAAQQRGGKERSLRERAAAAARHPAGSSRADSCRCLPGGSRRGGRFPAHPPPLPAPAAGGPVRSAGRHWPALLAGLWGPAGHLQV